MTARKRKVTVEEEETTTVSRRRKVEVADTDPGTQPIRWAPGWQDIPSLTAGEIRTQRTDQVNRAAMLVVFQALEGDPADDGNVITTAVSLLRAGPRATAMERLYGRVS